MVLLAASLAKIFFNASVPDTVIAAGQADRRVPAMVLRIARAWRDGTHAPPSHKVVSADLFYLHDRLTAGADYVIRTLFLPGPHHVGWVALPRSWRFAYLPLKLVHDLVMLPAWNLYQAAFKQERKLPAG